MDGDHDGVRPGGAGERLRLMEHAAAAAAGGIVIADARARDYPIVWANEGFERLTGYTAAECLSRNCRFLQGTDTDPEARARIRRALAAGEACSEVLRNYRKDGTPFWNELTLSPVRDDAGALTHVVGVQEDVSARVEADRWRTHLAAVVEASNDAIIAETLEGIVLSWNPGAERLYGYAAGEMIGRPKAVLHPPDRAGEAAHILARVARGERVVDHETRRVRKDGRARDVALSVAPIRDAGGAVVAAATIARDIGERKRHEARLVRAASHDALTGLPNRALFLARLQARIDGASGRGGDTFAVLFLDVDRFKYVNDSMGHLAGDRLLRAVARRLRRGFPRRATVARLGGDEFAVLIPGVSEGAALEAARAAQAALAAPIALGAQEIATTASIGVVLGDPSYRRPHEMLRDADTAMYEAKRRGKACVATFDRAMRARVTRVMRLEQDLRHALARGEFAVRYQPIVALAGGGLAGFEALLRWEHPGLGVVPPDEFIPLAEETGLIGVLDRWVLGRACGQMRDWRAAFPAAACLSLSVNLSGKDLARPEFAGAVLSALAETGLPAARLNVEITETAVIEHARLAVPMLATLRARGVGVHLDDFGTGYSSLTYLRDLPIDAIKIDRTFVRDMAEGKGGAVLAGVTAIAHRLDLLVIAEGIEDEAQIARLRAIGCDRGQGYLYAPPMTACEVEERLLAGAGHRQPGA